MDPLIKMAATGGAMLVDAQARCYYPHRLPGRRVVMIYDQAKNPSRDVAAMDRHLERMERYLGRKQQGKVHWIRGSALGLQGRYFQGLALGSVCDSLPVVLDGLTELDRHEAAHFALHHHCGPDNHPPSLLVEGWAETQSGHQPGHLALRAWKLKQDGVVFTLRELTNDWYYCAEWHVYVQGGALVEYLLREHGVDAFFTLYTTTSRETFAEDCLRVLGIELDELDRRYWRDVERQAASLKAASRDNPLREAELGEGVDREAWEDLIVSYANAILQRKQLARQVQMEIESTGYDYTRAGAKAMFFEKFILAYDGVYRRTMCVGDAHINVAVANPGQSFFLYKKVGETHWTRGDLLHSNSPQTEYLHCYGHHLGRVNFVTRPHERLRRLLVGPTPIITKLKRFDQLGQERMEVSFECQHDVPKGTFKREGLLVFTLQPCCALQSAVIHTSPVDGEDFTQRLEIQYDAEPYKGIPIVHTVREQSRTASQALRREYVVQIRRCEFVPTPEMEFTLAAFDVAQPGPWAWFNRLSIPWYVLVTWSGATLSILLGAVIAGWRIVRSRSPR
jgi:hypothetical protein